MLAVSAYADGKGPCPGELTEALLCATYGCLPESGGLDRQNMTQLLRHQELLGIYRACMTFNTSGWKALSGADKRLIAEISDLEFERGGNAKD